MSNWISLAEAKDCARRAMMDVENVPAGWEQYLRLGEAGEPRLVERLDQPGAAYYLVPWVVRKGVAGIIQVDASNGQMTGYTTYSQPGKDWIPAPAEAEERLSRQFPGQKVRWQRWGWMPCRQSTSPYLPVGELLVEDQTVFLTIYGEVVKELTPLGFGG